MENTKYQVFISSTYSDLAMERKQVLDILLMADCIPAGMESFVATDEEQFNVIKKVIDLCDYYILILGKRYGTVHEASGLSYTEMEYNYAIDKNIPVLVFTIDDSVELDESKVENNDINKGKLAQFKGRAMTNRLASIWRDSSDLMGKVAISIMQAKTEIGRPGWHRGSGKNQENLMEELILLKKENAELKTQIATLLPSNDEINLDELFFNKEIELHYTEKVYIFTSNTVIDKKLVKTTLDGLFKFISLRITGVKKVSDFVDAVSSFQSGYYVKEQDALVIRNKLEQLNFIESYTGKDDIEMIRLTNAGKEMMNRLNSN